MRLIPLHLRLVEYHGTVDYSTVDRGAVDRSTVNRRSTRKDPPMAISEKQVRHVALLARLSLTDEQVESLGQDLNSILGHIDTIQQLDLEGVEPTAHPLDVVNVTRADEVRPGLSREDALRNAPESDGVAFIIPRIVGPGGDVA